MAWNATITFTTGSILTAGQLNNQIGSGGNIDYLGQARYGWVARTASGTQATTNNTDATITLDDIRTQAGGTWWVVGTPTRVTPPAAGMLLVHGQVIFDGTVGTGARMAKIAKNGVVETVNRTNPNATGDHYAQAILLTPANGSSDYLELVAQQGSGGGLNVKAGIDTGLRCWLFGRTA